MWNASEVVREVGIDDFRMASEQQTVHPDHRLLGISPRAVRVSTAHTHNRLPASHRPEIPQQAFSATASCSYFANHRIAPLKCHLYSLLVTVMIIQDTVRILNGPQIKNGRLR